MRSRILAIDLSQGPQPQEAGRKECGKTDSEIWLSELRLEVRADLESKCCCPDQVTPGGQCSPS